MERNQIFCLVVWDFSWIFHGFTTVFLWNSFRGKYGKPFPCHYGNLFRENDGIPCIRITEFRPNTPWIYGFPWISMGNFPHNHRRIFREITEISAQETRNTVRILHEFTEFRISIPAYLRKPFSVIYKKFSVFFSVSEYSVLIYTDSSGTGYNHKNKWYL